MIEFSESAKLCLDSRLKSGMDLIANGSVTVNIWKVKLFVFFTKLQSYAPLPFNAFVPKLIHVFMKAISQNPIKANNQFCMLIKIPYYPERLYEKYVSFPL